MLVVNVQTPSLGTEREIALGRSLPVSPVGEPRQEQRPAEQRATRADTEPQRKPADGPRRDGLGSARARLAYDSELSRVFVEILDPRTGDVVSRIPPEQLAEHLASVVDRADLLAGQPRAGQIVDELA
jgi:hypothetical protein